MVTLAVFMCVTGLAGAEGVGAALQDTMVWAPAIAPDAQVYVAFRKTFQVEAAPAKAVLNLFADSRYILWVNGDYVERGPCRFDPVAPSYDSIDIQRHMHAGANTIAILVHHYHDGRATDDPTPLNGRTMRHVPGLTARIELADANGRATTILTDKTWRCTTQTRFTPSPISWGWIPDRIDARLDSGDWTETSFDDTGWEAPTPVDGRLWGGLTPRPILPLRETKRTPATLVRHGTAQQDTMPWTSALPLRLEAGDEAVIDVGRAVLAYGVFDLQAEAGTTLEVVHGHGYRNGQLDETYDSDRYIAKAGRQVYMSGDVCGFRYLLLKAEGGAITMHTVDIVDRIYPFDVAGKFECSDAFLNELWTRSVNTVLLCSEDGYTDCTARERTEWMGDSAFIEYPLTRVAFAAGEHPRRYGDPSLIANMLRHIAQSQQADGRLKAHHPSNRWDIHGYIEDYACLWLQTLRRYYDDTMDIGLVRQLWPNVTKQLDWFLAQKTDTGLVKARDFMFFDNPLSYKVCEGATLNAYLYGALCGAAYLAHALEDIAASDTYRETAQELARRFHETLWDESEGAYHGGILDSAKTDCTVHAATMALYCDLVPAECRARLYPWLAAHGKQIGSPYSCAPFLEVLYRAGTPEMDQAALNTMRERWASTLARRDLDTVFESFGGASLCHNAGAAAAACLSQYVLGVRREGPVSEKRIIVDPRPGDLQYAKGTVVTELGTVDIAWKRDGSTFSLDVAIPQGATATLRLPVQDGDAVEIDGKKTDDRNLAEGPHACRVSPSVR